MRVFLVVALLLVARASAQMMGMFNFSDPSTFPYAHVAYNCTTFNLTDTGTDAIFPSWSDGSGFGANLLHYNAPPNMVMDGDPHGPYTGVDPTQPCVWNVNGTFFCALILYRDLARTIQVGTATLSSTEFDGDLSANSWDFVEGYLTLTTTITSLSTGAEIGEPFANMYNFNTNVTTQLHFGPEGVMPTDVAPITNRIFVDPDNPANGLRMYLWGSNGYDPASMMFNDSRTTGADFRWGMTCVDNTPPGGHDIRPTPCPNVCGADIASFTQPVSCGTQTENGHIIRVGSATNKCATLTFSLTSTAQCSFE